MRIVKILLVGAAIAAALAGCRDPQPGCNPPNGAQHPVPATCTVQA